jgi:hypothetical protein
MFTSSVGIYKNIKQHKQIDPRVGPGNKNSSTITCACRKRQLKWVATLPLTTLPCKKENCWEASKKFCQILWRKPRPKLDCGAKERRKKDKQIQNIKFWIMVVRGDSQERNELCNYKSNVLQTCLFTSASCSWMNKSQNKNMQLNWKNSYKKKKKKKKTTTTVLQIS